MAKAWEKREKNGRVAWINRNHKRILVCAEGYLSEEEMFKLSCIAGYNPCGYGPIHQVEKGISPESGKLFTRWSLYTCCD